MGNESKTPRADDLLTVDDTAAALGRSPRVVWNLARDYELQRYRVPAQGKTTLLRWGDVVTAFNSPRPAPSADDTKSGRPN